FIQKLDAAGNFLWAKSMGGTFDDYGYSIITDTSGNVLITGSYGDTVDFDPGAASFNLTANGYSDVFIQKLDAAGNFIWAKSMGGTSSDYSYAMATDTFGNIYITGSYRDTADFDPGAATFNLISNGIDDIFIQKLDPGGNFIWAKSIGGPSTDLCYSITTDALGNVLITGYYQDSVDFDPGAATFNLTSIGLEDFYIQKLTPCAPSTVTDIINACDSSTWIDGNTYISNNNTATHTLTNAIGCDSVVTLDLTITISNTGTTVITACDYYTWIDGNLYTMSNNVATHTLTNDAGCDSVVTLNLTINTVDVSVTATDPSITVNTTGASYQWLDCNNNYAIIAGDTARIFTASANGNYAVEVTENGCTDTSVCTTIATIDIEENTLFNSISIYPNPIQELVIIYLGNLREVSIKVFNVSGQLIYRAENINASSHQFKLNGATGIYSIELSSQGQKQQYKLVKE
ncbi:MAG: SBBP repeat-containing protein, partial [Bacteroidetes bacterium]|nr:SBBP repeat-containing protein [Bacteroidota bacterium]